MSNKTKAIGIGTILLMLLAGIGVVSILLATYWIVSAPTTGQQTVDAARQAQIDQDQAQTGLIVAQTGKTDAEARSIDRASTVAVFQQLVQVALNVLACGLIAAVICVLGWGLVNAGRLIAREVAK
jgi:hypothetical protein